MWCETGPHAERPLHLQSSDAEEVEPVAVRYTVSRTTETEIRNAKSISPLKLTNRQKIPSVEAGNEIDARSTLCEDAEEYVPQGGSTGNTAHTRPTNPSKPVNNVDEDPPHVEGVVTEAAGMRKTRDPTSIHSALVTNEKEIVTFSFEPASIALLIPAFAVPCALLVIVLAPAVPVVVAAACPLRSTASPSNLKNSGSVGDDGWDIISFPGSVTLVTRTVVRTLAT